MTPTEILEKARDLLVNKGWTQRCYYRDSSGMETTAEHAASYCMLGATAAAAPDQFPDEYVRAVDFLKASISSDTVVPWNDEPGRTKEQVLIVFDKAIERSKHPPEALAP